MAKEIFFTQCSMTLYNASAVQEDVGRLNWWRHRKAGTNEPLTAHGFKVPPGTRVDASKLTEVERERLVGGIRSNTRLGRPRKASIIPLGATAAVAPKKTIVATPFARKVKPVEEK